MISDKGDPLRSPLTPLKKGGIIGKAGIFKCGNHLTSAQRPNIIIIHVDDLALGDVGVFGCPDCSTPNIDALAASGVKMTNAYTINAPCTPSRTGLMMGMYTHWTLDKKSLLAYILR
ncbi:sulfatase-like hydrolase/transferase [Crocosphaera watsonii WH 8501]|nr:sulfatase-like hydrolase/transferase [Crocosphaera watsonii]